MVQDHNIGAKSHCVTTQGSQNLTRIYAWNMAETINDSFTLVVAIPLVIFFTGITSRSRSRAEIFYTYEQV